MVRNKITNLPQATANWDAIDFKFYNHYTPRGIRDNDGDFDFRDSMLYNVKKSFYHTSVATVEWLTENYIARDGGVSMTGNLNAGDNTVINMVDPQSNKDAVNKKYAYTNFLKLTGGDITGAVSKDTQPNTSDRSLQNYEEMKLWLVEKGNPSLKARLKWPIIT